METIKTYETIPQRVQAIEVTEDFDKVELPENWITEKVGHYRSYDFILYLKDVRYCLHTGHMIVIYNGGKSFKAYDAASFHRRFREVGE